MYVKIIYKCKEDGTESELTKNYLEENNLHFNNDEELNRHVEGVIEFQRAFGLEIEGIEVINIPKEEYFEYVQKQLNRYICKTYAKNNNIDLGSTIKEQVERMNDIDFKINAYEYIVDYLEECMKNPFVGNNNEVM